MLRTSIVIPVALMVFFSSLLRFLQRSRLTNPAWQQAVEKTIESYIRSHPEVIEQTLQALDAKRQADEQERVKAAIAARQFLSAERSEFPSQRQSEGRRHDCGVLSHDRCGLCKRAAAAVTQLQKEDPRVRVVYKDLPILGEASETVGKAALASRGTGEAPGIS